MTVTQYHIATITFHDSDPKAHVQVLATEENGVVRLSYSTPLKWYEEPSWITFSSLSALKQFIAHTYAASAWGLQFTSPS